MSAPDPPLVPLRIRLPYATEPEFVSRYGSNLSRGGIFIATRAIKPEGTALAFELVLKNGDVLLHGEAVVAKTQVDSGGGRSGMTLRFVKLDAHSREVLDRVLAQRAASAPGASPAPTGPSPAASAPPETQPPRKRLSELSKRIDAALARPEHARQEPTQPSSSSAEPANAESANAESANAEVAQAAPPPSVAPVSPEAASTVATADATNANLAQSSRSGDRSHRPEPVRDDGLLEPLQLPALPEAAPALVEPVLGIELTGTELRVGAWSGASAAAEPVGTIPAVACFHRERWYLGEAAAVREGAVPLFAAPGNASKGAYPDDATLTSGSSTAPLRTLAAHLFAQLRAHVEQATGRPVRDAVLAVPAWFSYRDRVLVTEACRLGGLQVRQIVHATSAACVAFAQGRALARKRVLVLHPETARFEASVIQVTGEDLEVISTRAVSADANQDVGLEQVAAVTRDVLTAAGASAGALDEVVRFGDPAALNRAEPTLSEILGRPLPEPLDADATVHGAALLGHAYAELARGKRGGSVFEVLVSPLSLVQRNGTLRRVLEVGTRLPAEKTLTLPLAASEMVALILCDGFASHLDQTEVIGAANVESGPLGGELSVHLAVDRNGQVALSTSIGGGKFEARPLTRTFDPTALLPLTLPPEPSRKSGFFRGLVGRIGKG